MSDDYLWDRSGKPDPDVERLEALLGELGHRARENPPGGAIPGSNEAPGSAPDAASLAPRPRGVVVRVAFGAAVALAIAAAVALVGRGRAGAAPPAPIAGAPASSVGPAAPEAPSWEVTRVEGAPRIGDARLGEHGRLALGGWLETDGASRARIAVAGIGEVNVAPGSRVRLAATGAELHRLDLERGRIDARVEAPPRLFVVGTPAATAVDLGCAYTLEVDPGGAGRLEVTAGWVSLEDGDRTALVPAGARCETRPGVGPGTPYFGDASAGLREALRSFDFEQGGELAARKALAEARPRDSLTVWHLLHRVDATLRREVYRRLRELRPPPPGVGELEAVHLDPPAMTRWKNELVVTW